MHTSDTRAYHEFYLEACKQCRQDHSLSKGPSFSIVLNKLLFKHCTKTNSAFSIKLSCVHGADVGKPGRDRRGSFDILFI